jgi:hypothetical protein
VVALVPDSGAVLVEPPAEVEILFDEVVSERVAAQRPDIASAVLLSPAVREVKVEWHRDRLTVRPREDFQPGRVYRVQLLPVITDLRQNRMREGRLSVFSTGPEIDPTRLSGTVVDWVAGRGAALALVEAVLLPDSLPYRLLADSSGDFVAHQLPRGEYLVYGVVDQDGNRRFGPREAFDTLRITLDSTADVAVFAFPHDTVAPRIRTVELVDSVTLRLVFDRPLDPTLVLDTGMVWLAPAADSTARLTVTQVLTPPAWDSVRAAAARRPAADTGAPAPAPPGAAPTGPRPARDTAAARPGPPTGAARPAAPGREAAPRDSTRAQRLLSTRPPPSDARIARLLEVLVTDMRYIVGVDGARSLSGVAGSARAQLSVPRPRRPAARDTTRAAADSVPPAPHDLDSPAPGERRPR